MKKTAIVAVLLLILVNMLKKAKVALSMQPYSAKSRGFRNNNPFNLRTSLETWIGKVPLSENKDFNKEFEQFYTIEKGLRAGMINIRTHINRGNKTIKQLISKHAPSSENDTNAFITAVAKRCGGSSETIISVSNKPLFLAFVDEIIRIENGSKLPGELITAVYDKYIK